MKVNQMHSGTQISDGLATTDGSLNTNTWAGQVSPHWTLAPAPPDAFDQAIAVG